MDLAFFQDVITNIGFPISCCGALAWYIQKRDNQQAEDRKIERETLKNEIDFNRSVNIQLLETNKMLASDIKIELQDIKSELKFINKEV